MRLSSLTQCCIALMCTVPCWADSSGHLKANSQFIQIDNNSAFQPLVGDQWRQFSGELRLNFSSKRSRWRFNADYQLVSLHDPALGFPVGSELFARDPSALDDHQLWDLTHVIDSGDDYAVYQRFDRLNVGYQGDQLTLTFGRQAVSWGNGLFFNPMDVLTPFSPLAIDTEYKLGSDLLYGQYLFNSGNDLQFLGMARRNEQGELDNDESSLAGLYHQFLESGELSVLVARHYQNTIVGVGLSQSLGEALWQTDLTYTRTPNSEESFFSGVTNVSYSWVFNDTNMSGAIEYFYSGVGLPYNNEGYQLNDLQNSPNLNERLARSELYTIGQHYLATSLLAEVHPLVNVNVNALVNLQDFSSSLQVLSTYDASDNLRLTAVIALPMGSYGSEYRGLSTATPNEFLSTGPSVFAQIAWYF